MGIKAKVRTVTMQCFSQSSLFFRSEPHFALILTPQEQNIDVRQILIYTLFFNMLFAANTVCARSDSTLTKSQLTKIHHEKLHHAAVFKQKSKPDIIERFVYGKQGRVDGAKVKKLPAAIITVFLGPFGGHRIYLGTDVKVPIIYTLTLGGGFGILPLCDLVAILISKDLNEYAENSKIVMWINSSSK